jgi:hypothetical protein
MPPGTDCLTLPALQKSSTGQYEARSLDVSIANIIALRARIIRAALEAFEPDAPKLRHRSHEWRLRWRGWSIHSSPWPVRQLRLLGRARSAYVRSFAVAAVSNQARGGRPWVRCRLSIRRPPPDWLRPALLQPCTTRIHSRANHEQPGDRLHFRQAAQTEHVGRGSQ